MTVTVLASTLELVYQDIVNSLGYKTTVGRPTNARSNAATRGSRHRCRQRGWRRRRGGSPRSCIRSPHRPPPAYKKVAPRVAYAEGGSTPATACIDQPGVVRQPDGTWRDDVAQYDRTGCAWAPNGRVRRLSRRRSRSTDGRTVRCRRWVTRKRTPGAGLSNLLRQRGHVHP